MFNEYGCLPEGIHRMSWEEVKTQFNSTDRRKKLIDQIEVLLALLRDSGCTVVYLDGSFVTDKLEPGDIDLLFDFQAGEDGNVIYRKMLTADPILDSSIPHNRKLQKMKYGSEIFYAQWSTLLYIGGVYRETFFSYFQRHRNFDGIKKGLIQLDLATI